MDVQKIPIKPVYQNSNGTTVIRVDSATLPIPFIVRYEALIYLPPKEFGGNHRHVRKEAFIGTENLELIWINSKGEKRREKMQEKNSYFLFVIPPLIPHVVLNKSQDEAAVLFEFADIPQLEQELVEVI